MAKDAYHEIFLHLVWHTKESRNLIAPDMEQRLHDIIRRRAVADDLGMDRPGQGRQQL